MNKIIHIGFMGLQSCYLNVSKEEAIKRYKKDNDISDDEQMYDVREFEFDDEFEAYDIWKK